eukprot:g9283.t1
MLSGDCELFRRAFEPNLDFNCSWPLAPAPEPAFCAIAAHDPMWRLSCSSDTWCGSDGCVGCPSADVQLARAETRARASGRDAFWAGSDGAALVANYPWLAQTAGGVAELLCQQCFPPENSPALPPTVLLQNCPYACTTETYSLLGTSCSYHALRCTLDGAGSYLCWSLTERLAWLARGVQAAVVASAASGDCRQLLTLQPSELQCCRPPQRLDATPPTAWQGQCVTYCGAGSALQALSVTTVWSEADCELSLFHEQRFRCGTTDLVCEPLAMVAAQVSRQMLDALKVDMVLNERVTDDYLLCHNAAPAAAARVLCPVARQTLGLTDDRCGALAYACAAGGGTIECDGGWTRDPTVDPFCTTPQSDGLSPVPCDCGVHWTPVVQALAPSALIDSQCYLDMQSGGLSKANLDAFRLCTSNAPAGGMSCAARGLVSLDELVLLWLADDVPEAASRGLLLEHSLRGTDPRASVDSPAAVLLLLRRLLAADGGGDRILLGEVLATNRDRRAWCLGADDTGAAAPVCALRPGLGLPLCTVHCPVGTVVSAASRAVRCCNSRGCCWLGTAGLTYSANETKLQRLPVGNDTVCRPNLFPELTAYPRPTATAVLAPSDAQRQLCFEDVRCQAIVLFANGGVFFSERELNFPLAELRRLDPGRLHQLDEDKQSTRYLHPVPERELAARGDTVVTSLQSAVVGLDRRDQMAIIQRALLRVDLVREVVRDALVLRNIFEARRATGAAEAVTAAAPVALPEGCGAGRGPCVSGGAWPGAAAELALLAQAQDDLRAGRLRSSEADRFRVGDHAVAVAEARCEYDAPWGEKVDLTGHEPLPSRCETLSMTWPWQFAAYWNWRNWVALDAFSHGATRWSANAGNCSSLSFPLWRNEPVLVDGRWQGCFEPRCPQPVPYDYDWYARSTVSWSVPDTTVAPRDATVAPCGWDRGICGSNGRCQCNSGFRVKPNTDPTTLVYDAAGDPRVARVLQQDACDIDGRGVCKSKLSYGSGEDCSGRGVCVADFRADERAATCRCGQYEELGRSTIDADLLESSSLWPRRGCTGKPCSGSGRCTQARAFPLEAHDFDHLPALARFSYRVDRFQLPAYLKHAAREERYEAAMRAAADGQACQCDAGFGGKFCQERVCAPVCHVSATCYYNSDGKQAKCLCAVDKKFRCLRPEGEQGCSCKRRDFPLDRSLPVPTKEIVCGPSALSALVRVIGDQKFPWACACQTGAFETDSGLCKAKVVALVDEYGTPPQ